MNNDRTATTRRRTKETAVTVMVNLDGSGKSSVETGIKFLDHMIVSLAKHTMLDLNLKAESLDDIRHHLVEDTGIALGGAIDDALGDRAGIARFGHASVPLDESLAEATVDLVRRPFVRLQLSLGQGREHNKNPNIEDLPKEDLEHFLQSMLQNMMSCTHLEVRYGENDHHKAEADVKSLAVALRSESEADPRRTGAPSTKGSM